MKSSIFWDITPCREIEKSTDISGEHVASILFILFFDLEGSIRDYTKPTTTITSIFMAFFRPYTRVQNRGYF
jgi:hypothetical protein